MKNLNKILCSFFWPAFFLNSICYGNMPELNDFNKKFPGLIYHDIYVNGLTVKEGKNMCDIRYQFIKPYLDSYDRPFKVLDIGAAQGYFSFRTAYEYPESYCVMVEANDTKMYKNHGDMLYDLCFLNTKIDNVCYLKKALNLEDLKLMNELEHFDVIYCMLVLHLMFDNFQEKIEAINLLLSLGDHVVIETANNVDVRLTDYIHRLSQTIPCEYIGEVNRNYDHNSKSTGKIYCFKGHSKPVFPFKKETYDKFNGVYP